MLAIIACAKLQALLCSVPATVDRSSNSRHNLLLAPFSWRSSNCYTVQTFWIGVLMLHHAFACFAKFTALWHKRGLRVLPWCHSKPSGWQSCDTLGPMDTKYVRRKVCVCVCGFLLGARMMLGRIVTAMLWRRQGRSSTRCVRQTSCYS